MKYTTRTIRLITVCAAFAAISILLRMPSPALAQTVSPTPESMEKSRAQIEELKERLATKVAELRTLVKRAMYGTVTSVSLTSAVVDTSTKQIKIELGEEVGVAQLIRGTRTDLEVSDVEEDDIVTVFGNYDDTLDLLQAKYIFIESASRPVRESGDIISLDRQDNTITVKTKEGREIIVDIERTTDTFLWSKEAGTGDSGFSELEIGHSVHVTGTPDADEENRISAARILSLGYLMNEPPTSTPEASPSASPSATPAEES